MLLIVVMQSSKEMKTVHNAMFQDVTLCGSFVRTDISEEHIATIIKVKRISALVTEASCEDFFAACFSCYLQLTLFLAC
jgi:hypothetical protein